MPAVTEIRPGTYIYNDMNTVAAGFCTLADCAATLVCHGGEHGRARPGHHRRRQQGRWRWTAASSARQRLRSRRRPARRPRSSSSARKHGTIDVTQVDGPIPKIGDRVAIIPNHVCPCVNLQDGAEAAVR